MRSCQLSAGSCVCISSIPGLPLSIHFLPVRIAHKSAFSSLPKPSPGVSCECVVSGFHQSALGTLLFSGRRNVVCAAFFKNLLGAQFNFIAILPSAPPNQNAAFFDFSLVVCFWNCGHAHRLTAPVNPPMARRPPAPAERHMDPDPQQ